MKNRRTVFIPAILAAAACLCLILYSITGATHHGPPPIGTRAAHMGPRDDGGSQEMFKTLGTVSVFCAAASYAWYQLKKKRKSASPFVRQLVRLFDKLHRYAGYAAIVLVGIHGIYFLTQAAVKKETYTGIAAFALLLTLGIYGFLIKRIPNKYVRKIHFLLATGLAVAAIVHAGGTAILGAISVVAFWSLVWLFERMAKPAEERSQA